MCTVTFLARKNGYALGMNRDEQRTRPRGLRPKRERWPGGAVLSPSEPGGGTWIALNDRGICLALINWYSVRSRPLPDALSRGEVIQAARTAVSPAAAHALFLTLPLPRIRPFRLIGVFPATREIIEWRWDRRRFSKRSHAWRAQQWASSGFDEPRAQRIRAAIFRQALREKSAGRLTWLRRLHRSHQPQAGPCSMCMHRPDAVTVSYTEVSVAPRSARMRYHVGAPCEKRGMSVHSLVTKRSRGISTRTSKKFSE